MGIDASTTNLGFCIGNADGAVPKSGVRSLPGADEMVFDRTLMLAYETVSEMCRMVRARHVFIEAPLLIVDSSHGAHTTGALVQLTGAIRAAAARTGAQVSLYAVSTVRKHFIGIGNLKRAEAKRAVMDRCRLLGWDHGGDDNRADAMAVFAYGMAIKFPKWAPQSTPMFARVAG